MLNKQTEKKANWKNSRLLPPTTTTNNDNTYTAREILKQA